MDYESLFEKIKEQKKHTEKQFIYGYGSYGRNFYRILQRHDIAVDGFVVTGLPPKTTPDVFVRQAKDYFNQNVGFIVALNEKSASEVKNYLHQNGVQEENIIDAGQYIMGFGKKRGVSAGSYEVVTTVGCPMNCRYCPQKAFLSAYYADNKNNTKEMSLQTFKTSLEYFPKNYDISFGGMSEPFLNQDFMTMLEIACSSGRLVSLYTTLVGLTLKQAEKVSKLNISNVVIHVADSKNYANINVNDEYLEVLKYLISAKKADGSPFVNMLNAQTTPHERVMQISGDKYEILTDMTDRAGNLQEDNLISNKIDKGKIECWNIGKDYVNCILLPNGQILLCCMDFGMKHILGNIFEENFEEILNGGELKRVRQGMAGDESIDILCRACSYARQA